MKLTAKKSAYRDGFALPTVLLVSTVTLIILVSAIAAAASSRVALDSQYYNQLAQQAIESGIARANECLRASGYTPQWSMRGSGRDLRPNSDCSGNTLTAAGTSPYVLDNTSSTPRVRTAYTIDAPNGSGIGSQLRVVGVAELVRSSNPNSVWRRYEQVGYLRIEPMHESVSCSTFNVGDTGPGGGVIFYKQTSASPNVCYEVARQGWFTMTAPNDPFAEYGCRGIEVPNTGITSLGSGQQNTVNIVAQDCQPNIAGRHVAAMIASNYRGGSKSDWYLPSRDEAHQLYLQRAVVGDITATPYWTSSQSTSGTPTDYAWYYNFSSGASGLPLKSNAYRVRPIRSFTEEIKVPGSIACPEGFISVPGNSLFGTSDFCVGKYEAKSVNGAAVSRAAGVPMTMVTQSEALVAATSSCDGCHLITEAEWLTIAHNVMNVASNWSGGQVGNGYVYRGHSDGAPSSALAANTNDSEGYFGTGNTSGDQRRTLTLSNGEVIWDFAGNVAEWTSGSVSGAGSQPGAPGYAWRDWLAVAGTGTLSPNPFPAYGTPAASGWTYTRGIGRVHSDSSMASLRGFIRGGNYGDAANAGIFSLGLDNAPDWGRLYIGFRVVK